MPLSRDTLTGGFIAEGANQSLDKNWLKTDAFGNQLQTSDVPLKLNTKGFFSVKTNDQFIDVANDNEDRINDIDQFITSTCLRRFDTPSPHQIAIAKQPHRGWVIVNVASEYGVADVL